MGIYNCETTLEAAIVSILEQTVADWELILCDDGSTDRTYDIARRYQEAYPEKVILLKNQTNQGLNYTLNKCLNISDAEYIARMDADDISEPTRLEEEIKFLEKNKDYDFGFNECKFI